MTITFRSIVFMFLPQCMEEDESFEEASMTEIDKAKLKKLHLVSYGYCSHLISHRNSFKLDWLAKGF